MCVSTQEAFCLFRFECTFCSLFNLSSDSLELKRVRSFMFIFLYGAYFFLPSLVFIVIISVLENLNLCTLGLIKLLKFNKNGISVVRESKQCKCLTLVCYCTQIEGSYFDFVMYFFSNLLHSIIFQANSNSFFQTYSSLLNAILFICHD